MTFKEETIRSERVYEGRVINLRRDEVMTVSGKPSVREIVEHGGGVALVAVTDEGKIIMERQFRKPLERDVLEIPAGKLEAGEDPLEAAGRELAEETGYRAENIEYLKAVLVYVYSFILVRAGLALCEACAEIHIKRLLTIAYGRIITR